MRTLTVWFVSIAALFASSHNAGAQPIKLDRDARVVLVGNGLGSRMMRFGYFETDVQIRFADKNIVIRNLCDEGDTAGFRPHSGRNDPWAFPGAEKYRELKKARDTWGSSNVGNGFFETPDQWLSRLKPDVIVAFFGFNESFEGPGGLNRFKTELTDFVLHTKQQKYNGQAPPRLALVSPIAFEDLSAKYGTPDGKVENTNLALYTAAMEDVARKQDVLFVDLFTPSHDWFKTTKEPLTRDGALLTDAGYKRLGPALADALFGRATAKENAAVLAAVREKNWMWLKYYKIPNGVHVFGRRNKPFGPQNYPDELKKLEEMVANRDRAIWAALAGQPFDLAAADASTHPLPKIGEVNKNIKYLSGADALATFKVPEGYKIELFASEKEFKNLAKPSQLSFDNKGRLWVSTMPVYPHYKPGDPKPNDKLIILEDTNGDGKADKETIFAEGLHLPLGFEFAPEGVYVSQGNDLVLLRDTDGDDRADVTEIVLSGFDDHDTHHAISAFCADPSGAIIMAEGTFLHSNIETAYGPVRSSNGGFFRYDPSRRHLERTARLALPNPWGTAFDEWGQCFFADTSDPNMRWMLPGSMKVDYGDFAPLPPDLLEAKARVRPTSGLEVISSRHFPDEVQGDILINNTIGFQGTKQHQMIEEGTGYTTKFRQDLLVSSDRNFRPVDMEFAPDGSLYLVDWHNALIGHMQHSARDPNRDHEHGRIYRITYPSRPLVTPAKIAGASIQTLLNNLKLPEYRARYATRRELRGRNPQEVLSAINLWTAGLDKADPLHEHHLLEALWVTWGLNRVDDALLRKLLVAKDHRARAAAVHVLRYSGHRISDQAKLLAEAAGDAHGRVRLEALVAATWLPKKDGLPIVEKAGANKDKWMDTVHKASKAFFEGQPIDSTPKVVLETKLTGDDRALFIKGAEVYGREGHCITCHQQNGDGLIAAHFPPLAGSEWVTGNPERLAKIVLHGVTGPIEVKGVKYPGNVPMISFKFLTDEELAAVLTYIRNSFGNQASVVTQATIKAIREATKDQVQLYTPEELLKMHPN